jgi:hypothetical protein
MARKRLERGERWRLRQTVDKANYDFVASNIEITGHKDVTELLDEWFLRCAIQIRKAQIQNAKKGRTHGGGQKPFE